MKSPNEQALELRALQYLGNQRLDRVYAALGPAVAAAIRRASTPGPDGPVLTEAGKQAASREISRLIENAEPKVVDIILRAMVEAEAAGLGDVARD